MAQAPRKPKKTLSEEAGKKKGQSDRARDQTRVRPKTSSPSYFMSGLNQIVDLQSYANEVKA